AQSEHHHHNTNKESIVFEPALEEGGAAAGSHEPEVGVDVPDTKPAPRIPLHLVIAGCPSLKTFYQGNIRHWHQLFDAACHVRPAMGISSSAWEEAQRFMGPEQASIVVVAMLERFAEIRSPGGYLRALTSKAAAGEFSCGQMVMALVSQRGAGKCSHL
ncbi:replication initiation protein, partial [Cereibacter changlensis JA139]